MSPKEASVGIGALALLAVAAIVVLDDKTPDVKVQEKRVGLTRLAVLDGGKAYIVEVEVDAGAGKQPVVELRRATTPGCVRRPAGAPVDACLRDWGQGPRDFGDLNRFSESEAVGAGCEPVACSVVGEDSLASEDDRIEQKKAAEGKKP